MKNLKKILAAVLCLVLVFGLASCGSKEEDHLARIKKAGKLGFEHGDYEGDEMQLPALFLLDQDKTVTYAHYAKSLSDMPEVSEMIALL